MKLSIITINYNNKLGLEKTINSVVNQSYKDFEFIIIDGNSTDGSQDLVELYKSKMHYSISEPDTGVYNAMNKGIKVANGEYIIFMNSGDTFFNDDVLQNVKPFLNKNISIIYGNSAYLKNDIFVRNENPPNKLTFNFFFKFALNHQAVFTKRELFQNYFYYNEDYIICSDWEFMTYAICLKSESYLKVEQYICKYDLSGISAMESNQNLYKLEREQTFKKYFSNMYDDYIVLKELDDKRIRNFLYIKKFNIPWKILKGFSKIILLFLPKQNRL